MLSDKLPRQSLARTPLALFATVWGLFYLLWAVSGLAVALVSRSA